jgi:four helix bundle protein
MGSASELEYQLILAHDLGFIGQDTYNSLNNDLIEVKKILLGFIRKVKQRL